jgi:hypothetical protein
VGVGTGRLPVGGTGRVRTGNAELGNWISGCL